MADALTAWVVDDDQSVRWVLEKALRQADIETRTFERGEHLLDALESGEPDVLITDVRMPGIDGLTLLDRLRRFKPDLPVIVVTAHSDLENAVAAYEGGAFEYLPKPFDVDEAVSLVRKAARQAGHALPDVGAGGRAAEGLGGREGLVDEHAEVGRAQLAQQVRVRLRVRVRVKVRDRVRVRVRP